VKKGRGLAAGRDGGQAGELVSTGVNGEVISTPPPLYILYGESRMKHTGRCENEFGVRG
jgi:hypothetical protein